MTGMRCFGKNVDHSLCMSVFPGSVGQPGSDLCEASLDTRVPRQAEVCAPPALHRGPRRLMSIPAVPRVLCMAANIISSK